MNPSVTSSCPAQTKKPKTKKNPILHTVVNDLLSLPHTPPPRLSPIVPLYYGGLNVKFLVGRTRRFVWLFPAAVVLPGSWCSSSTSCTSTGGSVPNTLQPTSRFLPIIGFFQRVSTSFVKFKLSDSQLNKKNENDVLEKYKHIIDMYFIFYILSPHSFPERTY